MSTTDILAVLAIVISLLYFLPGIVSWFVHRITIPGERNVLKKEHRRRLAGLYADNARQKEVERYEAALEKLDVFYVFKKGR